MRPRVNWQKLTIFGAMRIKADGTRPSKGRQIFVERQGFKIPKDIKRLVLFYINDARSSTFLVNI